MAILPESDEVLGVIGGQRIPSEAAYIAELLGHAILKAGYKLATGGRKGAGEYSSKGAAAFCVESDLDPVDHISAIIPWGKSPDFGDCRPVHAGNNTFERGLVLMDRVKTVFIIGGGTGTEHEIMHAAVDDHIGWGTANIMPVSGTGGIADNVLARSHSYGDPLLDNPNLSLEKAQRLIESINEYRFPLFKFWDVDIHDRWLTGDQHPVVRRTFKIRHYRKAINIEGD